MEALLHLSGLQASGFSDAGLQFIRRKWKEDYIYFVSNIGDHPVNQWISLAKKLSSGIFCDPYTGKISKAALKLKGYRDEKRHTLLYLQLSLGQSIILKLYINKNVNGPSWRHIKVLKKSISLEGIWEVRFLNENPIIDSIYKMYPLISWTTLNDSAKVFSGTARYTFKFNLSDKVADDWLLSLGEVDFSADIKINGDLVVTLWAVPFTI